MFSKDFYFTVGAILVIFVGGLWLLSFITPQVHPGEARLFLAFENYGQGRMFAGEVVDGMTILDALVVSSEAGQIKFTYRMDQSGKLTIEGIDGYTHEASGKEVVFYLNKVKVATEYIGKVGIRAGDGIEVHLE